MTITILAVLIAADITALLGCIKWRINHRYIKITPVEIKGCKNCKHAKKTTQGDYCIDCLFLHTTCSKEGFCYKWE